MVCDRHDLRLAENYLSMYESLKDNFEEAENDIIFSTHVPEVRPGRCGYHISDNTANRAIEIVDLYHSDEYLWFKAMQLLHSEFGDKEEYCLFLLLRYQNAQELSFEEIAEEMEVSRTTVFTIRSNIVYFVVYKYYQLKAGAVA